MKPLRTLKKLMGATALTAMLAPAATMAGTMKAPPAQIAERATLFEQIDTDNDNLLSRKELMMYHDNAVSAANANSYMYSNGQSRRALNSYFYDLDANSDSKLSEKEFSAMTNDVRSMFRGPTYYTVTYYAALKKIDADDLEDRVVKNLDGDRIGEIENIVRMKKTGDLVAFIDLDGSPFYRLTSMEPDVVGVKLEDLLFVGDDESFAMTNKGEAEIRDMDQRVMDEDDFEDVDRLYTAAM